MKASILKPVEITISAVKITVPIRYGDEDVPMDFPLRSGDIWTATVDVDTGQIREWPEGRGGLFQTKVCDLGVYELFGESGEVLAKLNDYVPHGLIPGEYGDYIVLEIDSKGVITNWPRRPSVSEFFKN